MPARLSRRFFARPADELAPALLGKILVHGTRAGRIVETEAYLGPEDLASHARFGKTPRNEVMFGPGGVAYVYFVYGMYYMFNVVAGRADQPGAVLIRALEPVLGLDGAPSVARGPGKLTRALEITREHNAIDLTAHDRLYLLSGRRPGRVAIGPRIGVDYAGKWATAPLRFWIEGNPAVSGKRG